MALVPVRSPKYQKRYGLPVAGAYATPGGLLLLFLVVAEGRVRGPLSPGWLFPALRRPLWRGLSQNGPCCELVVSYVLLHFVQPLVAVASTIGQARLRVLLPPLIGVILRYLFP